MGRVEAIWIAPTAAAPQVARAAVQAVAGRSGASSRSAVRCRGMRLCEPCMVVEHYASRPVLRAPAHRGGLRADSVAGGAIAVGDGVRPGQ